MPGESFCKRESYLELKIRLMGGGTSCDRLRVPMGEISTVLRMPRKTYNPACYYGPRRRFGSDLIRTMAAGESFVRFCTDPSGGRFNESPIVNPSLSSNPRTSLK
jgi:hypothetical protein